MLFYFIYIYINIHFRLEASEMKEGERGWKTTKIILPSRYHERDIRRFFVELCEMYLKDQI